MLGQQSLIGCLEQIRSNHPPMQFDLPQLQFVGHRARDRPEVRQLLALEPDIVRIGGQVHPEQLQPRIFNLVLKVGRDLDQRLAEGGVLEAGHLHPRLDLLEIQAQRPRGLQHPEREHALLADARLLRVQLGEALGGGGLETHPLLGHHQQRAAMLPRVRATPIAAPASPGSL